MILIRAGSHRSAKMCAQANELRIREWQYLGSPIDVRGRNNFTVWNGPGWFDHPEADAIKAALCSRSAVYETPPVRS